MNADREPGIENALLRSRSATVLTQRSQVFRRRALPLLLLLAVVLVVPLSPVGSWLLERAPDAFLQWEARWMARDARPHLVMGERLLAVGQTRPALEQFERAAS